MFLGLIFIFLIIGIFFMIKGGRKLDKDTKQSNDTKNEFDDVIKKNNIIATQQLFLPLEKELFKMIVLDDVNKNLVYLTKAKKGVDSTSVKVQYFKFSDVIGCELINITKNETTEDIASLRDRRRTHTIVYRQGFRIVLNDLSNPSIEMIYIDETLGSGVSFLTNIEEWMSKINIVIHKGKQEKVS